MTCMYMFFFIHKHENKRTDEAMELFICQLKMKYCEYVTVTVKHCIHLFVNNMTESSHKKIYLEESDGVSARNLYKICYDGDNICLKSVKKSDRRWQSLLGFFTVLIVQFEYMCLCGK